MLLMVLCMINSIFFKFNRNIKRIMKFKSNNCYELDSDKNDVVLTLKYVIELMIKFLW